MPSVEVRLSIDILVTVSDEARGAGRDETGGILIGYYDGELTAVIDEVVPMPNGTRIPTAIPPPVDLTAQR